MAAAKDVGMGEPGRQEAQGAQENNKVGAEEGGGERLAEGGGRGTRLVPTVGTKRRRRTRRTTRTGELFLTLKKQYFDVMVTGEKKVEFRRKTCHWDRRLTDEDGGFRQFDSVRFQCGYNHPLRKFTVPRLGMSIVT